MPSLSSLPAQPVIAVATPSCSATRRLLRAAAKPYAALKADHMADHQRYFRRVVLDLGSAGAEVEALPTDARWRRIKQGESDPGLAAMFFQFGRYLLIGSSRPGTMPANLQGLWAWQMNPPWNADYHLNINLQMNYWPAEPTNLADCHLPLFDLMDGLVGAGRAYCADDVRRAGLGGASPDGRLGLHRAGRRPVGHLARGRGLAGAAPVGALCLQRRQGVSARRAPGRS